VVGPELIQPSEWLPVIWGGEEPVFQTDDEMRTILGTIIGRYNGIIACLDPDDLDPILLEGPEGMVIASDWAAGFLDAVALGPMGWKPLMANDDAADENELMAQTSDMIPICIAGIHEFWRNYRKPSHGRGRSRSGGGRRRLN
jgi:uncharacterized protein